MHAIIEIVGINSCISVIYFHYMLLGCSSYLFPLLVIHKFMLLTLVICTIHVYTQTAIVFMLLVPVI